METSRVNSWAPSHCAFLRKSSSLLRKGGILMVAHTLESEQRGAQARGGSTSTDSLVALESDFNRTETAACETISVLD